MGLSAEAFAAAPRARKGPRCTVALVLAALDPEDRAVLSDALAASTDQVSHSAIAFVLETHEGLRDAGLHLKAHTIGNHRRGNCACA